MPRPLSINKLIIFFCGIALVLAHVGAAEEGAVSKNVNAALKYKNANEIAKAIQSLQDALADESLQGDEYTRGFLELLIKGLQADPITYSAIIKETAKVAKNTRDAFLAISEELKTAKLSRKSRETIIQMKRELTRMLVTHSFCVAPFNYEKYQETSQMAVYYYSKAWNTLYEFMQEQRENVRARLETQALTYFQKANELLSMAGSVLERIQPKKP